MLKCLNHIGGIGHEGFAGVGLKSMENGGIKGVGPKSSTNFFGGNTPKSVYAHPTADFNVSVPLNWGLKAIFIGGISIGGSWNACQ